MDADGTVEATSDDPWFYFAYDERWRIVATYRDDDSDPKEQFVHHNAGLDGMGGSSYIDTVILRDKDANTAWTSASDGTLEERLYHCQNWRADVVALVDDIGDLVEQDRYSSYGVPFGMFSGDVDGSGSIDANDTSQIQSWITTSTYVVRGDLDLDGSLDAADKTIATNNQGTDLGWGLLSAVGSRRGLAGYESDTTLVTAPYHVRARVLDASLGRWLTRDPLQYSDGVNLVAYAQSNPMKLVDPSGTLVDPILELTVAGPPMDDDICRNCERARSRNDGRVNRIKAWIRCKCTTCEPNVQCKAPGTDEGCDKNRVRGYTPRDPPGSCPNVTLCCRRGVTVDDYIDTMQHELQHLYDICAGTPMPPGTKRYSSECARCICMEIRGQLAEGNSVKPYIKEQICDRRRPNKGCGGNEDCGAACSDAFEALWDHCSNLSPKPWLTDPDCDPEPRNPDPSPNGL